MHEPRGPKIVTQSQLTREELLISERRYRRLFEAGQDGILILNAETLEIIDVNPFMLKLLDYSRDEFLGKELWEIGLFADKGASQAAFRALQDSGYMRYEDLPLETRNGHRREVEFISTVYDEDGRQVIQCNIRDITQRRQAEMVRERLAAIVKFSDDAILSTELGGIIVTWNSAAEKMFGYSAKEILGKPISKLIPRNRIDEEAKILKMIKRGETLSHFETVRIAKDGKAIEVSLTMSPIRNDEGTIIGASKIARDISELKRAGQKIRRLNAELEQRVADRTAQLQAVNKEIESFSYSVSHDLRAPLRHINGFSQALLEDYADKLDDVGQDYLSQIRGASREMGELIDDVLKLARVTRSEMVREKIDLSELATGILDKLRKLEPERIVKATIEDGLVAYGDKRLLEITLTNLLENAWKFTSKQKKAQIVFGFEAANGNTGYFVRDNGAGFDMAYADKLYRAFQRLHDRAEFPGTGIGLATVQRIINRHGGRVWAESEVNMGATFHFSLPGVKESTDED